MLFYALRYSKSISRLKILSAKFSVEGFKHLSNFLQQNNAIRELFIEDIKICRSEGIPMSASDKAVIVKFLKDNDVTAEPDEAKVQALRDEFQDELAAKREARRQHILMKAAGTEADPLEGVL